MNTNFQNYWQMYNNFMDNIMIRGIFTFVNGQQNNRTSDIVSLKKRSRKKIFPNDIGEYVEFEEIITNE